MTVTVLAIGDPHFRNDNLPEIKEFVTKTVKLITERKPDFVVCLGDILHEHEKISMLPESNAVDFLSTIDDIVPLKVVIGNHDRLNNSDFLTGIHPFTALKKWKNTQIADRVIDCHVAGMRFLFVPYVYPGRFREAIRTLIPPSRGVDMKLIISPIVNEIKSILNLNTNTNEEIVSILGFDKLISETNEAEIKKEVARLEVLFQDEVKSKTRQGIQNFLIASLLPINDISDFKYKLYYDFQFKSIYLSKISEQFAIESDKILAEDLKDFTAIFAHQECRGAQMGSIVSEIGDYWPLNFPPVISGHIHDYQQVQNNWLYPGTPMQHKFGDCDDKTVSLITFGSASQSHRFLEERIDLQLKKRRIIHIEAKEVRTWVPPNDGFLIKVVVSGTASENRSLKSDPIVSYHENNNNITFAFKTIRSEREDKSITDLGPGLQLDLSALSISDSTSKPKQPNQRISYLAQLLTRVETDPGQKRWFDKIFRS